MKTLQLTLEGGTKRTALFRAPKVKEYSALFAAWENENECQMIALTARNESDSGPVVADNPTWPEDLTPESYEEAATAMYHEAKDFFAWSGRRMAQRKMREQWQDVAAFGSGASTLPTSPSRRA